MNSTMKNDKTYIASTYNRFPVEIISGKGCVCLDDASKRYIDLTSGIGVTSFGMCDNLWIEAITKQINTFQHTSNLYYTYPCTKLAELLIKKTGMKKVFFSNSGAEANECLVKVARKWAMDNKGSDYYNIVTLKDSFHGRTLTTLALTGQDHYHELYQPLTPGIINVEQDLTAIENVFKNNKCAGILIECIQGEGGVKVLSKELIEGIYKLAKEYDCLFMVDEVQTGNGRTGKFYSYMNFDVEPDVVSTAKGLGGGLPIGACLMGERVENVFNFGDHGSTFGGNPVSCAGGISIVERITDELMDEVNAKGKYIIDSLKVMDEVEDVSGLGLMIGIKPKYKTAKEVVDTCLKNGVMALTAKNKIRLLPALNIPMDLVIEAVEIIKNALKEE